MIQITREAISAIMDENFKLYLEGKLIEMRLNLENRLKAEDRGLYDFIKKGENILRGFKEGENIPQGFKEEEGLFIRAGYVSGSQITYRILREQARINLEKLPIIKREDIDAMDEEAEWKIALYSENSQMAELCRIKHDNCVFGNYVIDYVTKQALNYMVSRGFAVGTIEVYSVYEQAYKRQNK